ncbi:hypothetical protein Vadar_006103 [Vaccinium darrowii]|uniref:Uncharacterized protein n=1 Tax=Vaccinium darrowii TaxID=229202 RepID=A0ACB7Z228_9ERIC|nr:hypothetical protein Vadar_006103 [Vaccinium darrowii]
MSSSSSNITTSQVNEGLPICRCRRRVVIRRSLTVKNPGRRFLGCVNFKKENGCNFFEWVDEETCPSGLEYAKIMQAKKEALEREVEDLTIAKQMVEQENEALICKLADLTETNAHLAATIEALNARIGATKSGQNGPTFVSKITVVLGLLVVTAFVIYVFVSSVKDTPKNKPLYLLP